MSQLVVTSPDISPSPWPPVVRRVALWASGISAAALTVAYAGASATADQVAQVRWTGVAVGAVVLAAVANAAWLALGTRSVRLRRSEVVHRVDGVLARLEGAAHGDAAERASTDRGRFVAGPGMTRYHRAGCLLVQGKRLRTSSRRAAGRGGRRPCEICRPDEVV